MKNISKKIISILAITICVMGVLTGCKKNGGDTSFEISNNVIDVDGDSVKYGTITEITENNLVPGLNHQFTEDELDVWRDAFHKNSWQLKVEDDDSTQVEVGGFIIHIYDENGMELALFWIDELGGLHTEVEKDGNYTSYMVRDEDLSKMLDKCIRNNAV